MMPDLTLRDSHADIREMLRYPVSAAVLATAALATAAVFVFARPHYADTRGGTTNDFAKYEAPSSGWTWSHGQPGFRFADPDRSWNLSLLRPSELAPARAAAARFRVDPGSIRPLHALRLSKSDLFALVSGVDSRSHTCIGAVLPHRPATFSCPARLDSTLAFLVTAARPETASKVGNGRGFTHYGVYPLFLMGAVRADVSRVTVASPNRPEASFYSRAAGWWGTFDGTPGDSYVRAHVPTSPWRATVRFYGAHGLLATVPVRLARPGQALLAVRPSNE
jgi:hypothetical protein